MTGHRPGVCQVEQHKQKCRGREECDGLGRQRGLEHISAWELLGNEANKVLKGFKYQAKEFISSKELLFL